MSRTQHYSGIGGQAVLEGVMMRSGPEFAVAVRRADGSIEVQKEEYRGLFYGKKILKVPFIRGIFVFIDSLVLGMKCLNYSGDLYDEQVEAQENGGKAPEEEQEGPLEKVLEVLITVAAFAIAIGLFMILPLSAGTALATAVGHPGLTAAFEGVLRLVIFLGYVWAISLMKDIRRLYGYHGAEHKCINCIESGRPLTVENVKKSSRFHRRCGSSFILFVLLVSIVLFSFITTKSHVLRLVLRFALLPVISGISYELIRLAGTTGGAFTSALSAPGLWMQRLTTREPDERMIEAGIASVEAVYDWRAYLEKEFSLSQEELERYPGGGKEIVCEQV